MSESIFTPSTYGRRGHLTDEQTSALTQFLSKSTDLSDEAAALRFLRARNFDVDAAVKLAHDDAVYRAENGVGDITAYDVHSRFARAWARRLPRCC